MNTLLIRPWPYLVIVLLGTALKFYHLNTKLFWVDEVSTVLYTSGINGDSIQKQIPVNQIRRFSYYDSLLHLSKTPHPLKNEVRGILSDTHLTPAHYLFLTLWYRLAGDNPIDYRLFSVFIYVLSLPFVFLLAKRLFNSVWVGWFSISLYAVSPIIQFEAQEARYYILWVFFFVLTNYLFLEAIKKNRLIWWVCYSAAAIGALYTSLSSAPFIFGHLLYTILFKKDRWRPLAGSLLFIGVAYFPWILFLYGMRGSIQSGLSWQIRSASSYFSLDLLSFQLSGFVRSFVYLFDAKLYWSVLAGSPEPGIFTALFIDLVMIILIIYATVYMFRKTGKESKWFMVLIILPLFMVLYISDVFRKAFTSMIWRYQIINMVGITFIVANMLEGVMKKQKWLSISIYLVLVVLGLGSILKTSTRRCWNTSPDCEFRIEEAQLIERASRPLIITDFNGLGFDRTLSVFNDSKAINADIMYCKSTLPDLKQMITGKGYSEIYGFAISDTLVRQLNSQFGENMMPYRKEPLPFAPQIWRISPLPEKNKIPRFARGHL